MTNANQKQIELFISSGVSFDKISEKMGTTIEEIEKIYKTKSEDEWELIMLKNLYSKAYQSSLQGDSRMIDTSLRLYEKIKQLEKKIENEHSVW